MQVETIVNICLYLAYGLTILALLLSVVFPLVNAVVTDPKSLVKVVGGVAIIAIIFGIGYALSNPEMTPTMSNIMKEEGLSTGIVRASGGSLIMMYILSGLAILGVAGSEVISIFK